MTSLVREMIADAKAYCADHNVVMNKGEAHAAMMAAMKEQRSFIEALSRGEEPDLVEYATIGKNLDDAHKASLANLDAAA